MNFTTPARYLRTGIPLAMILASVTAQNIFSGTFTTVRLAELARIITFIVLNFEAGRLVVLRIQRKIPGPEHTSIRFFASYAAAVGVTFLVISLSSLLSRIISPKDAPLGNEFFFNFLQCIWIAILIVTPLEVLHFNNVLYTTQTEKNRIEKQMLAHQLQNIQEMVNPHFLFNTLNTLSNLVTKDVSKAEHYIYRLSELYRQTLVNNRRTTITLNEELSFIGSYIYLITERFQNGISIRFEIEKSHQALCLVPLTLQILLENAIKHNALSPRRPLVIIVKSSDGWLSVGNNRQPKQGDTFSSGIGLRALEERYRLLRQPSLVISEDESYFEVSVPLISETCES